MLAKVDTFAKAVEICEEEEKAAKSSKQFVSGSADVNATSTYRRDQRSDQRAGQSQGPRSNQRAGQSQGASQKTEAALKLVDRVKTVQGLDPQVSHASDVAK